MKICRETHTNDSANGSRNHFISWTNVLKLNKLHRSSPSARRPVPREQNIQYLHMKKKRKLEKLPARFQNPDSGQACHTRLDVKGQKKKITPMQVSLKCGHHDHH